MTRVRSDLHAIFLATLLCGALAFFMANNGILLEGPRRWTPDALILRNLGVGLVYVLLFMSGHLLYRRFGVVTRWAYAGLGAVACTIAIGAMVTPSRWAAMADAGVISVFIAFAMIAGAVFGFLYHWRSGVETTGDDPDELQRAVAGKASQAAGAEAAAPGHDVVSDDGAHVDIGSAEYFNGPVQVRTSLAVMFVAALMGSALYGAGKFLIGAGYEMSKRIGPDMAGAGDAAILAMNLHLIDLFYLIFAPVPFAVVILGGHMAARALNKQSYFAYAVIGLVAPIVVGSVVFFVAGALVGVMNAIPVAVAMCIYRNMAGLEAKPVKEDVILRERRDLVGENHARRQFGRLVKS